MTIKELLYRELNGAENLKIKEVKEEVLSCMNEDFDFFVGTQRVEELLEDVSPEVPYYSGINRAINFLKVYENKTLKEEKITGLTAKILLHDIMMGLNESINALESSILYYKKADKENMAKIYSTLLFEAQHIGDTHKVKVDDLRVKNKELQDLIEKDFFILSEEIL